MDTVFGIPAHPLFVHLPAVAIPLAAIGIVIMVVRPSWWDRYRWVTLGLAVLGAVGAVLAAGSGESLEEAVEGTASGRAIHQHAEAGEAARFAAIVLVLVLLAAVVAVPRLLRRRAEDARPGWIRPVVTVALLLAAGAATWTVIDAGHSGAASVWDDVEVGGDDEYEDDDD